MSQISSIENKYNSENYLSCEVSIDLNKNPPYSESKYPIKEDEFTENLENDGANSYPNIKNNGQIRILEGIDYNNKEFDFLNLFNSFSKFDSNESNEKNKETELINQKISNKLISRPQAKTGNNNLLKKNFQTFKDENIIFRFNTPYKEKVKLCGQIFENYGNNNK